MLVQSIGPGVLTSAVLLLFISACCCQFPAICNTPTNLANKMCCPDNCGNTEKRGVCENITTEVSNMWETANSNITDILLKATNEPEKLKADSRYEWPTVVFKYVCKCFDHYGGVDCMDCDYGWTGSTCNQNETTLVKRQSFSKLSEEEKMKFVRATLELKKEMGVWAVIATEPRDYAKGNVTLQNVSTYDFYVYMHSYVARDRTCENENGGHTVDFAHVGPSFPVWHRHYLMLLEKDFQKILGNNFGLPYWQWEENDMSPFDDRYLGEYSRSNLSNDPVDVSGMMINSATWNTVCDDGYIYLRTNRVERNCSEGWKLCNPVVDRMTPTPLQRRYVDVNGASPRTYIPNDVEVKIAILAPIYDGPDYVQKSPRKSFRRRLEGWNVIRSAEMCSGGPETGRQQRMHNIVHDWVGGHMSYVPAAVNDPIFILHHCNIDRIMESWMNRFETLPKYEPTSRGHPGHNRDDYLVPFFPLVTAGNRYRRAEKLGYMYDSLITSDIEDKECTSHGMTLTPRLELVVFVSLIILVIILLFIFFIIRYFWKKSRTGGEHRNDEQRPKNKSLYEPI